MKLSQKRREREMERNGGGNETGLKGGEEGRERREEGMRGEGEDLSVADRGVYLNPLTLLASDT